MKRLTRYAVRQLFPPCLGQLGWQTVADFGTITEAEKAFTKLIADDPSATVAIVEVVTRTLRRTESPNANP